MGISIYSKCRMAEGILYTWWLLILFVCEIIAG